VAEVPKGAVDVPLCRHLCLEPMMIAATAGPLPLESVLARLPDQSDMHLPAKLTLRERGAEVLAELPRNGDARHGERHANQVLDAALGWLANGGDAGQPEREPGPDLLNRFEAALGELCWPWQRAGSGDGYTFTAQVDGEAFRAAARVWASGVQIVAPAIPVRVVDTGAARAIALFALEANARLRLTRVSVAPAVPTVIRVTWDAVLTADASSADWLNEVAAALAVARAETSRALQALATPAVAEAYLSARDPARVSGNEEAETV
jgi:hypothetical protein